MSGLLFDKKLEFLLFLENSEGVRSVNLIVCTKFRKMNIGKLDKTRQVNQLQQFTSI